MHPESNGVVVACARARERGVVPRIRSLPRLCVLARDWRAGLFALGAKSARIARAGERRLSARMKHGQVWASSVWDNCMLKSKKRKTGC